MIDHAQATEPAEPDPEPGASTHDPHHAPGQRPADRNRGQGGRPEHRTRSRAAAPVEETGYAAGGYPAGPDIRGPGATNLSQRSQGLTGGQALPGVDGAQVEIPRAQQYESDGHHRQ